MSRKTSIKLYSHDKFDQTLMSNIPVQYGGQWTVHCSKLCTRI